MSVHPNVIGKKLPSSSVCQRYGITRRTLARWMIDESLGFPKPTTINNRHYFDESKLDAFDIDSAKQIAGARSRPCNLPSKSALNNPSRWRLKKHMASKTKERLLGRAALFDVKDLPAIDVKISTVPESNFQAHWIERRFGLSTSFAALIAGLYFSGGRA